MFQEPRVESQSKEAELDRNNAKILGIGLVGIAASAFSMYAFLRFLSDLSFVNGAIWLGSALVFLAIVVLQTFFVKRFSKLFAMTVFEALAPLAFFVSQLYPFPSIPLLVGTGVFAVLLVFGSHEGWRFIADSLSIRFSFVSRNILAYAATGFLIMLSAVTFVWYFELDRFNPNDGYAIMTNSIISAEPMVRVFFPGASLNDTVETFFRKVAESELRKIPEAKVPENLSQDNKIDFQVLTKQQQERVINESGEALRVTFEKTLGPLPKTALVKDVLFSVVSEKIKAFSEKTRSYFGIIVAVTVFSILKGFFVLLGPLIRLVAFLVYKLLMVFGFAYVSIETRSREFILLG